MMEKFTILFAIIGLTAIVSCVVVWAVNRPSYDELNFIAKRIDELDHKLTSLSFKVYGPPQGGSGVIKPRDKSI